MNTISKLLAICCIAILLAGCEKNTGPKTNIGNPDTVLWELETGGIRISSPAIGPNGTVYVGSWDNKLYALSGKSGDKLWEFETRDSVRSSPAIGSDGTDGKVQ